MLTYQDIQDMISKWSDETFGSEDRTAGMIAKLKKEVDELEKKPNDDMELADCFILILDIAAHKKVSVGDLFVKALKKHRINQTRTWGPKLPDGSVEHIHAD